MLYRYKISSFSINLKALAGWSCVIQFISTVMGVSVSVSMCATDVLTTSLATGVSFIGHKNAFPSE